MANIANPRKQFNFTILIPGVNPWLAQKVQIPEESLDVTEHGDTNYDVKTAGRKKVGKIILEKLMHATGPDTTMYSWMNDCQNSMLGGGLIPSLYKKVIIIDEYSTDGVTVINSWKCYGCWPSKRDAIDLDRKGSDNTMEKLELEVDRIVKS